MKRVSGSARRLLLERAAIAAADDWVRRLSGELLAEHRVATGGWPGTLSEARNRTRAYVMQKFAELESPPPTADELELAARTSYARARTAWLSTARFAKDTADDDDSDVIP